MEVGGSLNPRPAWSSDQVPGQDSQGFTESLCFKKKKKKPFFAFSFSPHPLPLPLLSLSLKLRVALNSWSSVSGVLGLQVLRREPRTSCMVGKNSISWATSAAPDPKSVNSQPANWILFPKEPQLCFLSLWWNPESSNFCYPEPTNPVSHVQGKPLLLAVTQHQNQDLERLMSWWDRHVTPVLGRLGWEEHRFQTTWSYTVRLSLCLFFLTLKCLCWFTFACVYIWAQCIPRHTNGGRRITCLYSPAVWFLSMDLSELATRAFALWVISLAPDCFIWMGVAVVKNELVSLRLNDRPVPISACHQQTHTSHSRGAQPTTSNQGI